MTTTWTRMTALTDPTHGLHVALRPADGVAAPAWHITQTTPPYELLAIVPDEPGRDATDILVRHLIAVATAVDVAGERAVTASCEIWHDVGRGLDATGERAWVTALKQVIFDRVTGRPFSLTRESLRLLPAERAVVAEAMRRVPPYVLRRGLGEAPID